MTTTLETSTLVTDFWLEVIEILMQTHGTTLQHAQQAAQKYRQKMAEHEAERWIYHRSPDAVAEAIKTGGFLD